MDGIESQVLELKRSIEDLRVEQRAQLEARRLSISLWSEIIVQVGLKQGRKGVFVCVEC